MSNSPKAGWTTRERVQVALARILTAAAQLDDPDAVAAGVVKLLYVSTGHAGYLEALAQRIEDAATDDAARLRG